MASVEQRAAARGPVWLVRFRHEGGSRSKSFDDEASARRWLSLLDLLGPHAAIAALADPDAGAALAAGRTVAWWVGEHVRAKSGITEGTRADYASYLRRHIAPTIGCLPLVSLTRQHVGTWINELSASGLSAKSVRNRHSLLSDALGAAVLAGHLPTNVAKGVRVPREIESAREMTLFTPAQEMALVEAIGPMYGPLMTTLLRTGLRWGEATALQVRDVDLDAATLHVRRAWKHAPGGQRELGPPKSRRGRRSITLDAALVTMYRSLVEGRGPDQWLHAAQQGGFVHHSNFRDRAWLPAIERLLVEGTLTHRPRIHDARHQHASRLLAAGMPLAYVQLRLGHESIETTSKIYQHLLPDAHAATLEVLAQAYAEPAAPPAYAVGASGTPSASLTAQE